MEYLFIRVQYYYEDDTLYFHSAHILFNPLLEKKQLYSADFIFGSNGQQVHSGRDRHAG